MIERMIDFTRPRPMRCSGCDHKWLAGDAWSRSFEEQQAGCPVCGSTFQDENYPEYSNEANSLLLDDDYVRATYWYHTTTHKNWPDRFFDPASTLDDNTKKRMESQSSPGAVDRWTARQKSKALHVGTYEASVENLFRRIRDQDNANDEYYLYRLQLSSQCLLTPGIHPEGKGNWGDIQLTDVCAPGTSVFRYMNTHEDPTSVSLALAIGAIHKVQRIAIPLPVENGDPVVEKHIDSLWSALREVPPLDDDPLSKIRKRQWSRALQERNHLSTVANVISKDVAGRLPWSPGRYLSLRIGSEDFAEQFNRFSNKLEGLSRLVAEPSVALNALDKQQWRTP